MLRNAALFCAVFALSSLPNAAKAEQTAAEVYAKYISVQKELTTLNSIMPYLSEYKLQEQQTRLRRAAERKNTSILEMDKIRAKREAKRANCYVDRLLIDQEIKPRATFLKYALNDKCSKSEQPTQKIEEVVMIKEEENGTWKLDMYKLSTKGSGAE